MTDNKSHKILKLVISDNIFGGYEYLYRINPATNLKELVDVIIFSLKDTLEKVKLYTSLDILYKKNFHIHDLTIEEIINNNNPNFIVYVCGTC